jgi:NTP pyrophosphatase (non-canonical NTP hydrolase)
MQIVTDHIELGKRAVYAYGRELQLDCLIEEMAELMVALNHHRRHRVPAEKVIEEIADVLVMLDQAAYLFGENLVTEEIEVSQEKLRRKLRRKGALK